MAVEEDEAIAIPEWVVTFGDMMSLLLTFFIMLVSLSEIKQDDMYQAMVESMRKQFGHDRSAASLSPGDSTPRTAAIARLASMGRSMRAHLMKGGDKTKAPTGENPQVRMIRPGNAVNTGTVVFFEARNAKLSEQNYRDLQLEAAQLDGKAQKIEIRGHTSRQPVHPDDPFEDNWELAYRRARSVADYLISLGISRERIRVSAAAEHEPLHAGADPVQLKRNPRVEVFLLDELVTPVQQMETAREQQNGATEEVPMLAP